MVSQGGMGSFTTEWKLNQLIGKLIKLIVMKTNIYAVFELCTVWLIDKEAESASYKLSPSIHTKNKSCITSRQHLSSWDNLTIYA
ncbi:unnamed protein product [Camellia sinensis]